MMPESIPTDTTVLLARLGALLRQTLGTRVELGECVFGKQDHDYVVLLVQLRRPSMQVAVKLAGPQAALACPFDRTAMFHRLVAARTTLPMPEVLAADAAYRTWPWRYMIKTAIPGQEWAVIREPMNVQERADAHHQIGEAVAQLHTIEFEAFGEVSVEGQVQPGADYRTALVERARRAIGIPRWRDLFLSVVDQQPALWEDIREPRLCHEDLHGYNILFERERGRWRLSGILDFDKAWAGHHEIDLARLDLWRDMIGGPFWEAYRQVHPVEPLYARRRLIYQLLWCFEVAWPTEEHLADTRQVCAALGLDFERFE